MTVSVIWTISLVLEGGIARYIGRRTISRKFSGTREKGVLIFAREAVEMKAIIIAILIVIGLTGYIAWKQIDYTCLGDCLRKGYLYGYCKSICSWDNGL